MAVLKILEYPNERLAMESEPVTIFDDDLRAQIEDLFETLYETSGIGMSAPQADILRRIVIMDHSEDRSAPEIYINPEVVAKAMPGFIEETCLSLPGVKANVIRSTQVLVRAQDEQGDAFERELQGMPAVCIQHEIDHLDGKLFIDRIGFIQRFRARKALRRLTEAAAERSAA